MIKIYFLLNLFKLYGASTQHIAIQEDNQRHLSKISHPDSEQIENKKRLTKKYTVQYNHIHSIETLTTGLLALFTSGAIAILIGTFVASTEKQAVYTIANKNPITFSQTIMENTQSIGGFILTLLQAIFTLISMFFKNHYARSQNKMYKMLAYGLYFASFLSSIFILILLIMCLSKTSGGVENIIYGPDSNIIPIINTLSNDCWYCGTTGSHAAPNVFTYTENLINVCNNAASQYGPDVSCVFNENFLSFNIAYLLFIVYPAILVDMGVSFWKIYKEIKHSEDYKPI